MGGNSMKTIVIAESFSLYPGGRNSDDGDYNGERFRKEYLEPALKKNEDIRIDLNGTAGYGSSFLDEAFAGLIRAGIKDATDRITFDASNDYKRYAVLAERFMQNELKQRQ